MREKDKVDALIGLANLLVAISDAQSTAIQGTTEGLSAPFQAIDDEFICAMDHAKRVAGVLQPENDLTGLITDAMNCRDNKEIARRTSHIGQRIRAIVSSIAGTKTEVFFLIAELAGSDINENHLRRAHIIRPSRKKAQRIIRPPTAPGN